MADQDTHLCEDAACSRTSYSYDEQGSPASALGFSAIGVHAGFRSDPDRLDLALVVADEPVAAAATFTTNVFCAAPICISKEHLSGGAPGQTAYGCARAVVINSGIANAATGDQGLSSARRSAMMVADAIGCPVQEVLVASTGVIGKQLDTAPFAPGISAALEALARSETPQEREAQGRSAAQAIMTTDTVPKHAAVRFSGDDIGYPGVTFTIGGMAKGAGMIMPNMATMIAVVTTDAPVRDQHLASALRQAVDKSFNRVTVDSDTSTNDSCFLLASGAAAPDAQAMEPGTPAFMRFQDALDLLCVSLARAMAKDGEGATRLIDVIVRGAASAHDADLAARTVANSPLVKTAVAGRDANWGRIAAALGRSGATFDQEAVDISIMGIEVCRSGMAVDFSEEEALERFEDEEIEIVIDLNAGPFEATIWTCDLTHDYISINADYRS